MCTGSKNLKARIEVLYHNFKIIVVKDETLNKGCQISNSNCVHWNHNQK